MSNITLSLKRSVQSTLRDLKNTASKAAFKPAILDADQNSFLKEMQVNGFVKIPVEKIFGKEQWAKYCSSIDAFLADEKTQKNRDEYYNTGKTEGNVTDASFNKTFILKATDLQKDFLRKTPMVDIKSNEYLNGIINNYYGQPSKVIYLDYWYTLKTFNVNKNVYSQSWHCDPEGDRIVKVFIYFTDIDQGSGALQYIKGTQKGGKNAHKLNARTRYKSFYPDQDFIDANFEKEDIIWASAPKGTLVMCDTRGLHRGGKCLENERVQGIVEYLDSGSFAAEV